MPAKARLLAAALGFVLLLVARTNAQSAELVIGPHVFNYSVKPGEELRLGFVSPQLQAAARAWCEDRGRGLAVPIEQCASNVGVQATLELLKALDDDSDDLVHADDWSASCTDPDSCPALDSTSPVVFNCNVPIDLEGSMDIMAYLDFRPDDTPDSATERMRVALNDEYEEELVTPTRLAELVGNDVERAAKRCVATAGATSECRFGRGELEKIQCFPGRRSALLSKAWWLQLGEEFGLGITRGIAKSDRVIQLSPERIERVRTQIAEIGIATIPADELGLNDGRGLPDRWIDRMRAMMEKLHRLKLPPACILLYDDAWRLFHDTMHGFASELLGGPIAVRDISASLYAITQHANATREKDLYTSRSGHAPHRDSGDHLGPPSRDALGDLNAWLPLTDHVPPSPSIYVIPKHLDTMIDQPGCPTLMEKLKGGDDPRFRKKVAFDMQSVRAVPARAGDLVIWDGRLFHWASSADDPTQGLFSRLTMSLYSRDAFPTWRQDRRGFELLRNFPKLPWNGRLALLCGQLFIHIRHYPALFDFIARHFKACPKREDDGTLWDPLNNFPTLKHVYEQRREWEPYGSNGVG